VLAANITLNRSADATTEETRMSHHGADQAEPQDDASAVCRACGACCSYSPEWPRFSLEDDADLDRIPREFADHERGRMRCSGDRCSALVGRVGVATSCAVYAVRPEVCRDCLPGSDACHLARRRFGLEDLSGDTLGGALPPLPRHE
jgi:hypothetical protein